MQTVMKYDQSRAPVIEAPRASFNLSFGHKTTIDFDYIYPVLCMEILPGDTFTVNPTIFARLATPLYPIMDNAYIDIHFFWGPMRLLWDNSRKFFGEQHDPGDSIDYTIPYMAAPASTGYAELSLADYFGLPTKVPDYTHNALPFRLYNLCYNFWFRDQNLIDSIDISTADGAPDSTTPKNLLKRGKRFDYFTSCLAAPQKSTSGAQSLPLGTSADIKYDDTGEAYDDDWVKALTSAASEGNWGYSAVSRTAAGSNIGASKDAGLYADLSTATAATILQLRQAMAIQQLLELDARAGTRYNEIVYSVYGVTMIDVTYQPEFLGGGSTPINISQVPSTYDNGTTDSKGELGAFGTAYLDNGGFTKSFTEHGYLLGVVSARADLTYQQGTDKMWLRSTRYDFMYPILQNIGDQTVLITELYTQDPTQDTGGTGTPDNDRVFGYQERYADYKYARSMITGLFRSNCTSSLEAWHLSEEFTALPGFDQTFIEQNTPMDRAIKVTSEPHLILDAYFNVQAARPMHLYSIPGFGNRF